MLSDLLAPWRVWAFARGCMPREGAHHRASMAAMRVFLEATSTGQVQLRKCVRHCKRSLQVGSELLTGSGSKDIRGLLKESALRDIALSVAWAQACLAVNGALRTESFGAASDSLLAAPIAAFPAPQDAAKDAAKGSPPPGPAQLGLKRVKAALEVRRARGSLGCRAGAPCAAIDGLAQVVRADGRDR